MRIVLSLLEPARFRAHYCSRRLVRGTFYRLCLSYILIYGEKRKENEMELSIAAKLHGLFHMPYVLKDKFDV